MKELEVEVSKTDPNKLVEVGSYRMDANGNTIHKKVEYSFKKLLFIKHILNTKSV